MKEKPELKLTEWQRQIAGFGLESIAKAFTYGESRDGSYFVRDIQKGMRHFDEFLNDVYPAPELTEKEAELSSNLHTYMRKYMDSLFSCMIYNFIKENRGRAVWYAFIQGLVKNKYNIRDAFEMAREVQDDRNTTDDLAMLACLEQWRDNHDLEGAIKEVKSWSE